MKQGSTFDEPSKPATPDRIAMAEADAFLQAQDPADIAAMQWHARCEEGLAAAEHAAFQQWLAADPAHSAAFERLDRSVRAVRRLPAERVAHLRASAPQPAVSAQRDRPAMWRKPAGALTARSAAIAFCCLAMLAVGIGYQPWQEEPGFAEAYATGRGERHDITLPDGSRVILDAGTRVEVAFHGDRRQLRLARGQAMFAIARDASRPLTVLAGPARVTVLGTRFAVRCGDCAPDEAVDVEVEEGHVGVAGAAQAAGGLPGQLTELHGGQSVRVAADAGPGTVAAISPGAIAPWRKGLVRFSGTPLADAVREFERYGPVPLLIRDPRVAIMPVGGSYLAREPAAFAQALPHILPVRLVRHGDGAIEIVLKN